MIVMAYVNDSRTKAITIMESRLRAGAEAANATARRMGGDPLAEWAPFP
jgi:hypothetical protein